ncbi:hypothetical protein ILUMI_11273 [Ignelater luminosus]|uniref:Uncharacterized protein n=1 Tax=Ignelater luminosus TaxID=2038154 RepID=A0A8K0GDD9_IGNLU|nr:hypothetical protein ILUMI_11273 [Ignelater luminosus]
MSETYTLFILIIAVFSVDVEQENCVEPDNACKNQEFTEANAYENEPNQLNEMTAENLNHDCQDKNVLNRPNNAGDSGSDTLENNSEYSPSSCSCSDAGSSDEEQIEFLRKRNNEENIGKERSQVNNKRYEKGRQQIRDYFKLLPKVESHYCRQSTSKQYLEPIWRTKSRGCIQRNESFNLYALERPMRPLYWLPDRKYITKSVLAAPTKKEGSQATERT